jgi:hypothetical protein
LQNAHFDNDTSFWTGESNTQVSRRAEDAAGSLLSGSLDLSVTGADPGVVLKAGVSQCLAVTGGAAYDVGVQTRVPGQVSSQGGLDLWYFAAPNCGGGVTGSFSLPLSANASWTDLGATTTVPAGVQSAAVRMVVVKPYLQTTAEALFDNVVMNLH